MKIAVSFRHDLASYGLHDRCSICDEVDSFRKEFLVMATCKQSEVWYLSTYVSFCSQHLLCNFTILVLSALYVEAVEMFWHMVTTVGTEMLEQL